MEMIWIENPSILFDSKRLKYYFPGSNLTWEEQANSLMRFIIYLSLILYINYNNVLILLIPPIMMAAVQYYLYREKKLQKALNGTFGSPPLVDEVIPPIINGNMNYTNQVNYPDINPTAMNNDDLVKSVEQFKENKYRHITNQFDWDPKTGEPIEPKPDMALIDEEPEFSPMEIECKPPTDNNPFGNALPYDSIERQVNRVCPNEFKKDEKFYSGLFNSVDDLFDRNNSQRQFTTNPSSTRVNDREAAVQFFYNTPYTEH